MYKSDGRFFDTLLYILVKNSSQDNFTKNHKHNHKIKTQCAVHKRIKKNGRFFDYISRKIFPYYPTKKYLFIKAYYSEFLSITGIFPVNTHFGGFRLKFFTFIGHNLTFGKIHQHFDHSLTFSNIFAQTFFQILR